MCFKMQLIEILNLLTNKELIDKIKPKLTLMKRIQTTRFKSNTISLKCGLHINI